MGATVAGLQRRTTSRILSGKEAVLSRRISSATPLTTPTERRGQAQSALAAVSCATKTGSLLAPQPPVSGQIPPRLQARREESVSASPCLFLFLCCIAGRIECALYRCCNIHSE